MNRHFSVLFAIISLVVIGCNKSPTQPDQSESYRPTSVADGVTKLNEYRDTIKAAFDAGTPDDCDEAVHEAVKLLEVLPDVAVEEGLSSEQVESVKSASKELFDSLEQIHEGFHDHGSDAEHNSYAEVAEDIDNALASLAAVSE